MAHTTTEAASRYQERPGTIDAVPVRHPWRWVAVTLIAIALAMFLHLLITNPAFNWPFAFEAMFQAPVIEGLFFGTLGVALTSMLFAIVIGIIIAVMRLSTNPVLRVVAFTWAWIFRGIPRYVMLSIMGALGVLFPTGIGFGIPYGEAIAKLFGISGNFSLFTIDANQLFSGFTGAVIGMALSESAYMSEIARAGILSVDKGQTEAANALGMNSSLTMRRIVLPQAMRVIVPPTGSEFISMVKDTSLLIALPLTMELFFQLRSIGTRTFQVLPVLVAAALYYLAFTTILMFLQAKLEAYFGRGYGAHTKTAKPSAKRPAVGSK